MIPILTAMVSKVILLGSDFFSSIKVVILFSLLMSSVSMNCCSCVQSSWQNTSRAVMSNALKKSSDEFVKLKAVHERSMNNYRELEKKTRKILSDNESKAKSVYLKKKIVEKSFSKDISRIDKMKIDKLVEELNKRNK